MNVHLPFEDARNAFWIIIATMLAVVVGVAFFFRRRGWL
jgi:Mg2+ and Co2+ transporter CorA